MAEGRTLTQGSFDEVASDTRVQEAYLGRRH
jgi:branched-chain amino acid transport system ATP-binding protein